VSTFKAGLTGEYTLTVSRIEVKEAKAIPVMLVKGSAKIDGTLNDKDATEGQGKFYKAYGLDAALKTYKVELLGKGGIRGQGRNYFSNGGAASATIQPKRTPTASATMSSTSKVR